jgi:transposase
LQQVWAGVDIGKTHHHAVVIDADGKRLLSRRVANDEEPLVKLLIDVTGLAETVTWAVDMRTDGAALILALLIGQAQQVLYISGHKINRAADGYRGEGKTDARDAAIIADQARMRRDLTELHADDELIAELRLLVARRQDLTGDRTRLINRLRAQLLGICPALERALQLVNQGPVVLLTGFQTPAAIRETGADGLKAWLRDRHVRGAADLAARAVQAAHTQTTVLPGEQTAALLVAELAEGVITLNEQIRRIDKLIEDRFRRHDLADVIESLPGFGVLLGAEFLAATGGDMDAFGTPDRLAAYGGLAPAARDSGQVSGNLHRPQRYNRTLQRVFFISAQISARYSPESKIFYERKRREGKRHSQAVLALARRRVNVLWALIRDRRCYQPAPPLAVAA